MNYKNKDANLKLTFIPEKEYLIEENSKIIGTEIDQ